MQLGHEPKSLRVAFKGKKIAELLFGQNCRDGLSAYLKPGKMLHEPLAYSLLAEMTERRVAYIMNEACAFDDLRDGLFCLQCEFGIDPLINDALGNILSE